VSCSSALRVVRVAAWRDLRAVREDWSAVVVDWENFLSRCWLGKTGMEAGMDSHVARDHFDRCGVVNLESFELVEGSGQLGTVMGGVCAFGSEVVLRDG